MLLAIVPAAFRHCCDYLATVAALSVSLSGFLSHKAIAQVIPDDTLDIESSEVLANEVITPEGLADLIMGGAQRGENLFHSFERFSIGQGQVFYFDEVPGVSRIFSRVTGDQSSNILGTLGSIGRADLFFLNPNGILFGPEARLDVGGSFVASTADSVVFGQLGEFRAQQPELPSPLLTVQPSALALGQVSSGDVTTQAVTDGTGLQVLDEESLTLLGSNVTVDGGRLNAFGGQVNLVAAGAGRVRLGTNGQITVPNRLVQGEVSIENEALIDVQLEGGGDITISAERINIENSDLSAGIFEELGRASSQAGDIVLTATESIQLSNSSVFNDVEPGAIGDSGNIEITTQQLEVLNNSQIGSSTFGAGSAGNLAINVQTLDVLDGGQLNSTSTPTEGNAGNISIVASELVRLSGVREAGRSGIFSNVIGGSGNGGDIEITTQALEILNGAQIRSNDSEVASNILRSEFDGGTGDAGNIVIRASESVRLANPDRIVEIEPDGFERVISSLISSETAPNSSGDAGDIIIITPVLEVFDNSVIETSTLGEGDAGDIIFNVSKLVQFANPDGLADLDFPGGPLLLSSRATSNALPFSTGNGGDIKVTTARLEILDGAGLSSDAQGEGDAGDVTVNASESVQLANSRENSFNFITSNILSGVSSASSGNGGNIRINTPLLEVRDSSTLSVDTFGSGNGGAIRINAQIVNLLDGGRLDSEARDVGNAGSIVINASESVRFSGRREVISPFLEPGELFDYSGVVSGVGPGATGEGGSLKITTPVLEILDDAELQVSTLGVGDAGRISVNATDRLTISNGNVSATSESAGQGGSIILATPMLMLTDQANITTQTLSTNGGSIALNLDELLLLSDGSTISTEAGTAQSGGNGGNIAIDTRFIVATLEENNDIVADAFDGNGGNVDITATNGIFGIAVRDARTAQSDITASSENGVSGDIDIQTPEIDPSQGTLELPVALAGPTVVQSCRERLVQSGSEFVISGRGGVPQSPLDAVAVTFWEDFLPIEGVEEGRSGLLDEASEQNAEAETEVAVVEARGWRKNERGELVLVAEEPQQMETNRLATCEA